MLKSKTRFIITFLVLLFNTACGQDHVINEAWLNNFNAAGAKTVVLNNQKEILPIKNLERWRIASIRFGNTQTEVFDSLLSKYTHVYSENGNRFVINKFFNSLSNDIQAYNLVIVSLDNVSVLNAETINFLLSLEKKKQLVIALCGDEDNLVKLDAFQSPIVYCKFPWVQSSAFMAQLIFGGMATQARLTETTLSKKYLKGMGSNIEKSRFSFTVPEDASINAIDLTAIDIIAAEAIKARATPGAVVFVAKDGKVIFNKAYGNHTYQNAVPENVEDVFDLASVSKLATTTVAMRMYEKGQLNLDTAISAYLPETINTNKETIKVRELLLHQAGLVAYIPFFERLRIGDYSRVQSDYFSVQVADSFYVGKDYYKREMYPTMLRSPIKNRGAYLYSDLSMYFLKEIIERITHQPFEEYVEEQFFKPLGMYTTGYHPRKRLDKNQIVPTEKDTYFRKTLLWGFVHDQGAALVGGVAGHAGLFSNATDLGILFQMQLNKGFYGGKQYLKPETIDLFTSRYSSVSRRGLGFDKWDPNPIKQYPSKYASSKTFGHTGYTGTCVWVDPDKNLIYIFLSNRVHPKVTDKLSEMQIRKRILDVVYKAIDKSN
jgi:CubicO group peptidase (beta-lactamase class C family)